MKAGDGTGIFLADSEIRPGRDLHAPTPSPLPANESVWPKGTYGAIPTDPKIMAALGYVAVTTPQLPEFTPIQPESTANETLLVVLFAGFFAGYLMS